jgi:hypothetical protein
VLFYITPCFWNEKGIALIGIKSATMVAPYCCFFLANLIPSKGLTTTFPGKKNCKQMPESKWLGPQGARFSPLPFSIHFVQIFFHLHFATATPLE